MNYYVVCNFYQDYSNFLLASLNDITTTRLQKDKRIYRNMLEFLDANIFKHICYSIEIWRLKAFHFLGTPSYHMSDYIEFSRKCMAKNKRWASAEYNHTQSIMALTWRVFVIHVRRLFLKEWCSGYVLIHFVRYSP